MRKGKCYICGKISKLYLDYGGPGKVKGYCLKCSNKNRNLA